MNNQTRLIMTVNYTLRGSFNAPYGSRIEVSALILPCGDKIT